MPFSTRKMNGPKDKLHRISLHSEAIPEIAVCLIKFNQTMRNLFEECAPSAQNCPKGAPGPAGEKGEPGGEQNWQKTI